MSFGVADRLLERRCYGDGLAVMAVCSQAEAAEERKKAAFPRDGERAAEEGEEEEEDADENKEKVRRPNDWRNCCTFKYFSYLEAHFVALFSVICLAHGKYSALAG